MVATRDVRPLLLRAARAHKYASGCLLHNALLGPAAAP